jgi:HAD superfamily hydrolase (TIGR01509 family)
MDSNIKLIIADFDGVLCALRSVHYEALNQALAEIDPQHIITPEEHITIFDGLSTKRKLEMLTATKNLPADTHAHIHARKQILTIQAIKQHINQDQKLIDLLTTLKARGYKLCVASNAIRDTINTGLTQLGVWHLFDRIYSNEDVRADRQKPCPDIYLKAMVDFGVDPNETLIIEDSKHGREAAYRSGAFVCGVDNPNDLTLEVIQRAIAKTKPLPKRWTGNRVNIVVPMSGLGSRFTAAGYVLPKPLIDVAGKPMIEWIVSNLPIDCRFIFIVQKEHYEHFALGTLLNAIAPGCVIIPIDGQTEGACCTVLKAKEYIDNDDHLIIANSDQYVDWDVCSFMWSMISNERCDAQILTFRDTNPKWSFAKVGDNGWVSEVAEKRVISDLATVGIYAMRKGSEWCKFAEQMIAKNIRVNNEFYVAPVFNEYIGAGKKVKTFDCNRMYGMGTPGDLEQTLASGVFDSK